MKDVYKIANAPKSVYVYELLQQKYKAAYLVKKKIENEYISCTKAKTEGERHTVCKNKRAIIYKATMLTYTVK